jgi:hypothetical protein
MAPFRASRERHNISLAEVAVTVVQSHGRRSTKDDDELLTPVVEVVDELTATRLKLPERAAQRSACRSDEASRPYAAPVGNVCPHVVRITRHCGRVYDDAGPRLPTPSLPPSVGQGRPRQESQAARR